VKKNLLLFTGSFPYPKFREDTFLQNEVIFLSDKFNLTIVPSDMSGASINIDSKIKIDSTLAIEINSSCNKTTIYKVTKLLSKKWFFYELIIQFSNLIHKPKKLKSIIYDGYLAYITKEWFKKNYLNQKDQTILYTYWLNAITFGLSLNKSANKLLTRAHNVDLYEERSVFIPFRKQSLCDIDFVILISENGQSYLNRKYPMFKNKYQVFRLGTTNHNKPDLITQNKEKLYRIVSCSSISDVKRVLLIPQILNIVSKNLKEITFEWIHIGDGPLIDKLNEQINIYKNDNLLMKTTGYLENIEVLKFYKTRNIDVFLNISSYEGVPFTIMEAQSFGIPVIATDVGGNDEIVNKSVGLLIKADSECVEIAADIENFIKKNKASLELRKNSYYNWVNNFNSSKNTEAFVNFILEKT